MTKKKLQSKVKELETVIRGKKNLLIVMQDNPDPDSIAAAIALRKIAGSFGCTKSEIAYSGTVGRGENRALVSYLNLKMSQFNQLEYDDYDLVGVVDTQPGTGNNSLPEGAAVNIVIDHHPKKKQTRSAEFIDVRTKCGATSTIMLQYLTVLNIEVDPHLATALLYGIRSDTQDLGREATNADIKAIEILYPLANKRMLSEIQRGSVQREYFKMLSEALGSACVYGDCVIASLGLANNPDMIAEVADMLLRDEGVNSAICYGEYDEKILYSVRTSVNLKLADKVANCIAEGIGTGGGHQTYAGGQIPLDGLSGSERDKLGELIRQKALQILDIPVTEGEKLV